VLWAKVRGAALMGLLKEKGAIGGGGLKAILALRNSDAAGSSSGSGGGGGGLAELLARNKGAATAGATMTPA